MFGFFHRNATSGITIGTVTTGNTASAEITPDGKLNLVLPAMSQQAEERLTAVETQLASVAQTAQDAADDAAALTTEIQDVRSDYAADIEAARSALQGSINTVNATVSQHTTSISNAQRTADAAQASVSALQGTVATVQGDVSTAQSTANTAVNQAAAASAAAANALARGLEVVWHNPDDDGTSTTPLVFNQQDVSVDGLSSYIAFLVVYETGDSSCESSAMCLADQSIFLYCAIFEAQPYRREVSFSSAQSEIQFGPCEIDHSHVNNSLCVPLYVFGIKSIGGLPASA